MEHVRRGSNKSTMKQAVSANGQRQQQKPQGTTQTRAGEHFNPSRRDLAQTVFVVMA
ncbi:Hypothetical protein A7982_06094 [Minicystis rosea]|nr:Hypothetical protein A7982_06094 [Minicystis rosea]